MAVVRRLLLVNEFKIEGFQQAKQQMDSLAQASGKAADGQKNLNDKYGFTKASQSSLLRSTTQLRILYFNLALAAGVVGATFGVMIKKGAELNTMFTRMALISNSSINSVRKAIFDLQRDSIFSLEEVGNSFLELNKAGLSFQQAQQALPAVTNLAVAGFTDLATATKIVTQTMFQFNIPTSDAARVVDIISKAANASAADVQDFGQALSFVGGIAEVAGLSLEETAGAVAILTNRGLTGGRAGRNLQSALSSLIDPSDEAKDTLRQLGINIKDSEGNLISLSEIVQQFSVALSSSSDKTQTLAKVFSNEGLRAITGLLNEYEQGIGTVDDFNNKLKESKSAAEIAAEASKSSGLTIKKAWNDVKASFSDDFEAMSKVAAGFLESIADLRKGIQPIDFTAFTPDPDTMEKIRQTAQILMQMKLSTLPEKALIPSLDQINSNNKLLGKGATPAPGFKLPIGSTTMTVNNPQLTIASIDVTKLKVEEIQATKINTEVTTEETESKIKLTQIDNILTGAQEDVAAAFDKSRSSAEKELEAIRTNFAEKRKQLEAKGASQGQLIQLDTLERQAELPALQAVRQKELNDALERAQALVEAQNRALERQIDNISTELDQIRDSMDSIQDTMDVIGQGRFKGQTGLEGLILQQETAIKRAKFETYGLGSAENFLRNASLMTGSALTQQVNALDDLADSSSRSKREFEAWRTSLQEAIKSLVISSDDLGRDVTDVVKQKQEELLGLGFAENNNTSRKTAAEQNLDRLKEAFGLVSDEFSGTIQNHIQMRQDEKNTLYETADAAINAWENERSSLEQLISKESTFTSQRNELTARINDNKNALDSAREAMNNFGDVTDIRIRSAIKLVKELGQELSKIGVPSGGSVSTSKSSTSGDNSGFTSFVGDRAKVKEMAEGGIVQKPTFAMIGESGPEAVVPLNKGNMGININEINVNLYGSNAGLNEGRKIALEIKRELKALA